MYPNGQQNIRTDIVEFSSNSIYKVFPLEFGGFLAFEPDNMIFCRRDNHDRMVYRRLRTPLMVKCLCAVDSLHPDNPQLTKEGTNFMRYVVATENGEIYMLGFQLQELH